MLTRKVSVRISEEKYDEIARRAEQNNVTVSKQLRREIDSNGGVNIMDGEKVSDELVKLTNELKMIRNDMSKLGANTNQIAKWANSAIGKRVRENDVYVMAKNYDGLSRRQRKLTAELGDWKKRVEDLWRTLN